MVMEQGEVNLAGPVKVLSRRRLQGEVRRALHDARRDARRRSTRLGWSRVAAFQTRNPMHRSHEYLAKIAIEVCDGVLVHSLLGNAQGRATSRPRCARGRSPCCIEKYFRPGTVVQAGYPLDMRYAGPREALLHALFRQNYGCSHLIVGRDHAGVGSYYGPFDAHRIFDEIPAGSLETRPLEDRLDVLVLPLRRHGLGPHLSARDEGPAAGVRNAAAQVAVEGADGAGRILAGRKCSTILREYYAGLDASERVEVKLAGHSAR